MDLKTLKSLLSSKLNPNLEYNGTYKLASVLVVIYGKDPIIVMTEKPKTLNFHAGEISFPGGKIDPDDCDLLDTALRETREEIGLKISKAKWLDNWTLLLLLILDLLFCRLFLSLIALQNFQLILK